MDSTIVLVLIMVCLWGLTQGLTRFGLATAAALR